MAQPRTHQRRGAQLEEFVLELLGAFFDLRAAGQEHGLVNEAGAGNWGLMRILREEGPKTVPDIARMRSVSRQYIQKLANELIDDGLIEMVDNPAHKRSKLMRLSRAGERRFDLLTRRFRTFLAELGDGFRVGDLRVTTETIRQLRRKLARRTPSQPD
jgi:DNA-binding MarR family transcriptional regulator